MIDLITIKLEILKSHLEDAERTIKERSCDALESKR